MNILIMEILNHSIDMNNLQKGIYYFQVLDENQGIRSTKLIKL